MVVYLYRGSEHAGGVPSAGPTWGLGTVSPDQQRPGSGLPHSTPSPSLRHNKWPGSSTSSWSSSSSSGEVTPDDRLHTVISVKESQNISVNMSHSQCSSHTKCYITSHCHIIKWSLVKNYSSKYFWSNPDLFPCSILSSLENSRSNPYPLVKAIYSSLENPFPSRELTIRWLD